MQLKGLVRFFTFALILICLYQLSFTWFVRNHEKAMEAKEFFMLFYNLDCKHIAIENPMPMNIIGLPKYSQIIQPYMFGDGYSKKTCLWLKNLPPLYHNAAPNLFDENVTHAKEYQPYINGGGGRLEKPNYKGKTFANGSKKRSKFFQTSSVCKYYSESFSIPGFGFNDKY